MTIHPIAAKIPLIQANLEFNITRDRYLAAAARFFEAKDNFENIEELRSADREFHQLNLDLVEIAERIAGPDANLIELSATLTAAKIEMAMKLRDNIYYSHLPEYFQTEMLAKFGGAGLSKWVDRSNGLLDSGANILNNIKELETHGLCDEFAPSPARLRGLITMRLLPPTIQFFKDQIAWLETPNAVTSVIQQRQQEAAPKMEELRTIIAGLTTELNEKREAELVLQLNITFQHAELVEEAGESPLEQYIMEVGENIHHPNRQLVYDYLNRLNQQDTLLGSIQELEPRIAHATFDLANTAFTYSELRVRGELQTIQLKLINLLFAIEQS